MLTVKIRSDRTLSEEIMTDAVKVEFLEKSKEGTIPGDYISPGLLIKFNDGSGCHYGPDENKRDAWVMNSNGATVAHYRF